MGQWRFIIPSKITIKGKNFVETLISKAHEETLHGGIERTTKALADKYWIQDSASLIKAYIQSCHICQTTKYTHKPPIGLLTPLHIPTTPWTDISMDFLYVTPVFLDAKKVFPNISFTDGENHVVKFSKLLVIVCRHSKYKFHIPISDDINVQQVCDIMDQLMFPTIGYPISITLNRDPLFTSYVFTDWARKKGTRLDISTTYHQQADGQTEIVNKELRQVLKVIKEEGKSCLTAIPEI